MITCGWCGIHYTTWRNRCDSCGGPMPPLPGQNLGEPPPPVPRPLPKGFEFRRKWSGNVLALVGGIFFLIGTFIFLAFLLVGFLVGTPLPLLFMLGGFFIFRAGRRGAARTLNAFVHGTAVAGNVVSVTIDPTQTINGAHPWKLTYHFPIGNQLHEGVATSWDSTVTARAAGQPMWVLYIPSDPEQNTLYPPLK